MIQTNAAKLEVAPYPEKGRIKDAKSLHEIYSSLRTSDETGEYNRKLQQQMLDGGQPFKQSAIRASGHGYRFNFDKGVARAILDTRRALYGDLIDSVDVIARPRFPVVAGGPDFVEEGEAVAEEFHNLVRNDEHFDASFDILTGEFLKFGIGIPYFCDDDGWRWDVGGLNDFLIPRMTRAREDAIDILCIRRAYPLHKLAEYIRDEAAAKEVGWNVGEVKRALASASKNEGASNADERWAELAIQLKNNDHAVGIKTNAVRVVEAWDREYDGTLSHYMICEDGSSTDFLFKKLSRFKDTSDAFTIFCYDIGNGYYHSIRGLLWRMYNRIQAINRLYCVSCDTALLAGSILTQPRVEGTGENMAITVNGPVAYVPYNLTLVERGNLPNPGQQLLPVIGELESRLWADLGVHQTSRPKRAEQSRFEVQSQLELESGLHVAEVNAFYRAWKRLINAQFRRIKRLNPSRPEALAHYPEVAQFWSRLGARGVPPEVVMAVTDMEPVRAVGRGSPVQRMAAFDELLSIGGQLDDVGRQHALRDMVSSRFSRGVADRYVTRPEQPRVIVDAKIAELEHAALKGPGEPIMPAPGENHAAHVFVHNGEAIKLLEEFQGIRDNQPDLDPRDIAPQLEYAAKLVAHSMPQVQAISGDMARQPLAKDAAKNFNNLKGVVDGFYRQIASIEAGEQKADEKAQERAMKMQADQQLKAAELQGKQQLKAQETSHRMQLREVKEDQALRLKEQRAEQDMRLKEGNDRRGMV